MGDYQFGDLKIISPGLVLEQMINAEAKCRLKGIIAFADVNAAVNS